MTVLRSLNGVPIGRSTLVRTPTVNAAVRPSSTSTAATTAPLPRSVTPWTTAVPSRCSTKSGVGNVLSASPANGGVSHWKPSSTVPA